MAATDVHTDVKDWSAIIILGIGFVTLLGGVYVKRWMMVLVAFVAMLLGLVFLLGGS